MKYLFSVLFSICLLNYSYCQLKPVEDEIHRIDLKLEKFRSQHQTGTLLTVIGVVFASFPLISGADASTTIGLIAIGSALSVSGFIVSVNSYKHLRLESDNGVRKPVIQETEPQSKPEKPKSWWTPR